MNRIAVFLVLTLACGSALAWHNGLAQPADRTKAESLQAEIRQADIDFCKQTAARGLQGWMDFFAANAATIHEGKTVTGKEDLRKYYEPVFADPSFSLSWTPTRAEASQDGTLGYTYGDYEAKRGANVSHGMYVTVWRRENGRWKVALDLGSAAQQNK
jgi:ketosteroid isomerase-like protein